MNPALLFLPFLLPKWVIFHPRDAELPIWVVDLFGRFVYFAGKKNVIQSNK